MFRSRKPTRNAGLTRSKLETKAENIANDADKVILVGLIPLLAFVYIPRLVEWYMLRPQVSNDQTIDKNVQYRFMKSKTRLWAAALLWPIVVLIVLAYLLIF